MKTSLPAPGEVRKPPSWSNLNRRARLLGLTFFRAVSRSRSPMSSGRYQIRDGSIVLAGENFDLTLNHIEYYIAERERLVKARERALSRQVNTLGQNEEGSAEAATSPSPGSNQSAKGNAVNEQHDITMPVVPAMPDFEAAFYALEELIDIVQRRVKTVEFLVDVIDGRAITRDDPDAPISIYASERDALHSTARDAAWAVEDLSRCFDSVIVQVVAAEHGSREARETAQSKGGDSPIRDIAA